MGDEVRVDVGSRVNGGDAPTRGVDEPWNRERLFRGRPFALVVVQRVTETIAAIGEATMRTTKSQVAFRRRRGFAWLWPPVFENPGVEIVLSIALSRHDASPRFKQVAHPSPHVWMHHLEVRSLDELDDEVRRWLREAFDAARSAAPLIRSAAGRESPASEP